MSGARRIFGVAIFALMGGSLAAQPPAPRDFGAEVASLAAEAYQRNFDQSPFEQVRSGRLISRLPDITEAQVAENIAFAKSLLARLAIIPENGLSHQDALTAEILRWDSEIAVASEPFYWLTFPYTPYVAGYDIAFVHQQLALHPFSDPQNHPANYLLVLGEYADRIDQLQAHLDGQRQRGIYLSRHALPGVIGLFKASRDQLPSLEVTRDRLGALPAKDQETFLAAAGQLIQQRIKRAYDRFLASLESADYAAHAPDAVGLAQYPNGEKTYRLLVKMHTTLDITPEALHDLGKKRLAEIEAKLAGIRNELGFEGSQEEFHHHLRTDPRFFAKTPEEVEARFKTYIARIEPKMRDYFRVLPKAPYGVKRLDPAAEGSMTFGYYQAPTPDQPTGLYRFNGSKLDQRPMIWAGPLIYHELVPGHHFHFALQSENENLVPYRRGYLASSAFNEGWGNYGAVLAGEMGLLDDPYDRYGAALFDAFITARLVLDTGMNLLGWSLEEGRRFMAAHTFQSPEEIATETLRYATDLNGQALAYKAGLEKILELRERARAKAGERWDLRDFHEAVLNNGAMPLAVLEKHIEWTFSQGRR